MGVFMAVKFSLAGISVALLDYRPERAEQINRKGLSLFEADGSFYSCSVPCATAADAFYPSRYVVVAVKEYDTQRALTAALDCFDGSTVVLSIQNGFQHVAMIRSIVEQDKTVFGATAQGVTYIDTGSVRHAGNGPTSIAREAFNEPGALATAALLSKAGIETAVEDNLLLVLWKKLLFNASINGLTALLRIKNGRLPEIPEAWDLAKACFYEAREIAASVVGPEIYQVDEECLRSVCMKTSHNRSSMLQDVSRGKRTEVASFNGAIVEEGSRQGKPVSVNKMIFQLVTALEETER